MYQTAMQFAETMPDARVLLSDEPEMESSLHYLQLMLLVACLNWHWQDRNDYFIGANLTIYFSRQQLKKRDFRGPDFFLVKDVTNQPRNSWVVWEEGKPPDVVIELLSESTASNDKSAKKLIYQNQMRVSEYFWYDPFNPNDFAGFDLNSGAYQPIEIGRAHV